MGKVILHPAIHRFQRPWVRVTGPEILHAHPLPRLSVSEHLAIAEVLIQQYGVTRQDLEELLITPDFMPSETRNRYGFRHGDEGDLMYHACRGGLL